MGSASHLTYRALVYRKEFEESQRLRLRAIKMIDRLDAKHLVRWMAHRDLVLWYRELGKLDLAEKQQQIHFELVGLNDDRILYPKKRHM
jgi:hypothetical protein